MKKRIEIASGVYMNIKKRGINTTVGVRNASVSFGKNGTFINTGIPGTGFYKRENSGKMLIQLANLLSKNSSAKILPKGVYTFTAFLCGFAAFLCLFAAPIGLLGTVIFGAGLWANLSNRKKYYGKNAVAPYMTDAKEALLKSNDERQKRILSNFISTVETIDSIENEELIIESLNKKTAKNAKLISTHKGELFTLKSKLDATQYDIDKSTPLDVLALYEKLCLSFEHLLTSKKIWVQTYKLHKFEAKASAFDFVKLKESYFGVGIFNYIKTKFDVPIIPIGNQLLYLYPEYAILSQSPSQFEIVDYDNISMIHTIIRFNEQGSYPSDAERIGTTWEYINKDGSPDRRYSNNKQFTVVKYGVIKLTINNKFSETFQISNASFSDDFCNSFNTLKSIVNIIKADIIANISDKDINLSPSSVPSFNQPFSFAELIHVTDKMCQCLHDLSNDNEVISVLNNQPQLDSAKGLNIGKGRIDSRLGCLAGADLIKCFDGLGHRPDMSTDEGKAIGIILTQIIEPDNELCHNEYLLHQQKGQKILKDSYNFFKNNLQISFDADKFLLIEMLRHEGVNDETVNRWAVLLYRYALLIAKADGYLSETEQKWLTNILNFTKNGAVKTTKYITTTKIATLPSELDPLFKDAARYVVSEGVCSTSSIQRRFSIDYARAGKIIDQLSLARIIGPSNGTKPYTVIIDSNTLEDLLQNGSCSIETVEEVISPSDGLVPTSSKKNVQQRNIFNPMRELENLIGLSSVKLDVSNIYNLVKVQKIRASKGLNVPDISYHCVFTGNPGTGKTTVARLVAQIYKKLGILSKGHLVETDRSGLVAEYVGQTAIKTNKIIDSALDGVLFIDEAYSLIQKGVNNDFGLEAIATLLKRMEDNRDRLVVILAGYTDEMKQFIDSNPGLQSRFNHFIHFEDYSADELVSIYKFNLTKYDYRMSEDADVAIRNVMTKAVENKDRNFGNARFVRNFFEKTLERQAKRLASASLSTLTESALAEITQEDIMQITAETIE